MTDYATVAELVEAVGPNRIGAMWPGTPVVAAALQSDALRTGESDINDAGLVGGFLSSTVPEFVPVDMSSDPATQSRIAAKLQSCTIGLSLRDRMVQADATPQELARIEGCESWLDRLRVGEGFGIPPVSDGLPVALWAAGDCEGVDAPGVQLLAACDFEPADRVVRP